MQKIELDVDKAQQLLNYLTSRPWGEVNNFVYYLQQAGKDSLSENKEEEKDDKQ